MCKHVLRNTCPSCAQRFANTNITVAYVTHTPSAIRIRYLWLPTCVEYATRIAACRCHHYKTYSYTAVRMLSYVCPTLSTHSSAATASIRRLPPIVTDVAVGSNCHCIASSTAKRLLLLPCSAVTLLVHCRSQPPLQQLFCPSG
jgi:hypothetical protein